MYLLARPFSYNFVLICFRGGAVIRPTRISKAESTNAGPIKQVNYIRTILNNINYYYGRMNFDTTDKYNLQTKYKGEELRKG